VAFCSATSAILRPQCRDSLEPTANASAATFSACRQAATLRGGGLARRPDLHSEGLLVDARRRNEIPARGQDRILHVQRDRHKGLGDIADRRPHLHLALRRIRLDRLVLNDAIVGRIRVVGRGCPGPAALRYRRCAGSWSGNPRAVLVLVLSSP